MMKKQKTGFNIIDALIILVIVAAGVAAYFVFFGNNNTPVSDEKTPEAAKVRYVLQVYQLPSMYSDNITVGENVIDYGTHTSAGSVVAVDYENYVYVGHDKTTGEQRLTPLEDSVNLFITVEGDALMKNETYYVDNTSVYVGKRLDMMMPDLFCTGYVVSLETIE